MDYAIIAAGEGSRLVREGVKYPKPLVKLNGIPLIDRLITIFCKNNARSISIIVNQEMQAVQERLQSLHLDIPLNLIVKSTPSSMHSFYELSKFLQNGKFCLTTVDTIFSEDEFTAFINAFEADNENDGMMAVTDYIDDEKPLYISLEKNNWMIDGFFDTPRENGKYISGGIYCLNTKAIETLSRCVLAGSSKMRNYQRQLINDGLRLTAYPFKKIIDVDHAADISKAEEYIMKELTGRLSVNGNGKIPTSPNTHTSSAIRVAGVRRGTQYSPNHIGNDAAIFEATVEYLKNYNYKITEYSEEEFQKSRIEEDVIFNMARDIQSVRKLQYLEDSGKIVINSGYSIENCTREKMTRILLANHIAHPKSIIVSTDEFSPLDVQLPGNRYWVKRGDFHAVQREDVTYAGNQEEVADIIRKYALRNIPTAVVNEHIEGDLVKFYAIRETNFFYWFYPDSSNHSKFGWETINGKAIGIPFDINELKKICNQAACALNVYIYGGDCVIDKTGIIRIIDFNDWPSFAPCRKEVAPYIAKCIHNIIAQQIQNIELKQHAK